MAGNNFCSRKISHRCALGGGEPAAGAGMYYVSYLALTYIRLATSLVCLFFGCDFFSSQTDTLICKRTGGNMFLKMVSFAYL